MNPRHNLLKQVQLTKVKTKFAFLYHDNTLFEEGNTYKMSGSISI